jgi:hypothetical protein
LLRDPAPLIRRIDADDVDDAHPLVERVECNRSEPDGPAIDDGDEDIAIVADAGRPHGFGLNGTPIRIVEASEDGVAQYLSKRLEHRLPSTERKLDHGVEVGWLESANVGFRGHSVRTVADSISASCRSNSLSATTSQRSAQ